MKTTYLPLKTNVLQKKGDKLRWPETVSPHAYTIVYEHSDLKIEQSLNPLNWPTLYEAWAFDGERSWHIWQRDDEWVCTFYDPSMLKEEEKMEVEHFLAKHIRKKIKKTKLIIHQTIEWDEDNQAYIAYSCPIDFK